MLALGLSPLGCYVGAPGADGGAASAGGSTGASGVTDANDDDGGEGSGDSTGPDQSDTGPSDPDEAAGIPVVGARRLTPTELSATVKDLLGVETVPVDTYLPPTSLDPFDNDYTQQTESAALVSGLELLAGTLVDDVMSEPGRWELIAGCEDADTDASCFSAYLSRFGRRALRRPVTDEEHEAWMTFLEDGGGSNALQAAIGDSLRFFLQHPEFLYRIEAGESLPEHPLVIRLDDFEMATRLSYLLWGTTPDDWLLDLAEAGELGDEGSVSEIALEMLDNPRARAAIGRFHQMWLGYSTLPIDGALATDMQRESQALIERVVFDEKASWFDLFGSDQTYVTAELAEHYGLEAPHDVNGGWVSYGDSGRGGLLSHATFLSNGAKEGDTSPTLRGMAVRLRLMCQEIPPPPPNVDDSVPPPPEDGEGPICKTERFAAHTEQASCANCHQFMDPIGWGLERYDHTGAFRTVEAVVPSCTIDGEGAVGELGPFNGPGELGQLLAGSEPLGRCAATQLYRFTMGRTELDDADEALIEAILSKTGTQDYALHELIVGVVSDPSFFFARQPDSEE